MSDSTRNSRLAAYKNAGHGTADMRRKRAELSVSLRKQARDEQLLKRRAISPEAGDGLPDEKALTPEEIVQGLQSQDILLMTTCARAARRMLSREQNPPITMMVNAGVIKPLVDALDCDECSDLQFEAAWALTNIASGSRENTMAVVDVQKRLDCAIKTRKSTRLTAFDTIRKLPECPKPAPLSEAQQKMEHRRQQLEKWKVENEQKKKEIASQKKKPFLTGVARNLLQFVPLPPPPKPSASGRITSSMARSTLKPVKPSSKIRNTQSFAPKNATFKPPELKNLVKLPKLARPSRTKSKKDITFEPVVHTTTTVKQSRTKPTLTRQNATETMSSFRSMTEPKNTRGKVKKPSPKKLLQSSSSSSDVEPIKLKNRTPKKSISKPKQLTPKVIAMQSSSDDKASANSSNEKPKRMKEGIYL